MNWNPLPWTKKLCSDPISGDEWYEIRDANDMPFINDLPLVTANRILAVNAHEALVAGCEKACRVFKQLADAGHYPAPLIGEGWIDIDRALAQAKERK